MVSLKWIINLIRWLLTFKDNEAGQADYEADEGKGQEHGDGHSGHKCDQQAASARQGTLADQADHLVHRRYATQFLFYNQVTISLNNQITVKF